MQPFCGTRRPPAGTAGTNLVPLGPATGPGTCTACVQGLSGSLVTRNPLDLTRRFSIGSRRRQFLESGVFSSDDGRRSGYQPSCNSPALRMCPAYIRNDGLATRCNENGHTCAEHMPWNGLQSHSGAQVNFLKRYGGWRRIANPSLLLLSGRRRSRPQAV